MPKHNLIGFLIKGTGLPLWFYYYNDIENGGTDGRTENYLEGEEKNNIWFTFILHHIYIDGRKIID